MITGRPAALACILAAAGACVAEPAPGQVARAVVDGTLDSGDPAVVAIGSRRVGCEERLAVRCTGTLVAPRLVLTAAHCVIDPRLSSDLEVLVGAGVDAPGAAFHRVVQAIAHPDYQADGDDADVAVLVLDTPAAVAPVALPADPVDAALVSQLVRVVGFGDTGPTGEPPGHKRTGTAVVTELAERWFRIEASPSMSCHGDSGGPVLGQLPGQAGGAEVLLGVVSRGDPGCADYGINVRVDAFAHDFIEPWIAMADALDQAAAPAADPGAIAEGELCTAPCAGDADCPDGLVCRPGLAGDSRCVIPGLLAGALGSDCDRDDMCSDRCVRLRPDTDAGACRCHVPCADTPLPTGDDGGCSAAGPTNGSFCILMILFLTLVLYPRRLR